MNSLIFIAIFIIAWYILNKYLLPWLGIST
jgi:hypothetical protein